MAITYAKSCLIGALMESVAYGVYFCLFAHSMKILAQRLINGSLCIYLMCTNLVLFVLITLRMALDNTAAVAAFTNHPMKPNSAELYFTSFGPGSMWRTGTYIVLTLVADIFIVYRVFVVWNRNILITLLPVLFAVADIVFGGLFLSAINRLLVGANPSEGHLMERELIFYSLTLVLNVTCTMLIALRVWILRRRVAVNGLIISLASITTSVSVIIESSALYTCALIATIVPTILGSAVQYCLLSMLPGIIGISFSLILIRIGSRASPDTTTARTRHTYHPECSTDNGELILPDVAMKEEATLDTIFSDPMEEGSSRRVLKEQV